MNVGNGRTVHATTPSEPLNDHRPLRIVLIFRNQATLVKVVEVRQTLSVAYRRRIDSPCGARFCAKMHGVRALMLRLNREEGELCESGRGFVPVL